MTQRERTRGGMLTWRGGGMTARRREKRKAKEAKPEKELGEVMGSASALKKRKETFNVGSST